MQAKSMCLLALLAGCPDRTISALPPVQDKIEVKDIPAVPRREVDILFVVDDSLSMKDEQESLRANFDRFIGVLESIEGGLPDVQIGVITPNVGTSALDGTQAPAVGGCSGRGEHGVLRAQPGDGPRFLRDVDDGAGGRSRNYSGTLTEAFAAIANVGTSGCGIEQHLEATKLALDGSNPENAGFLRPNAYLAIIVIADEDDCSLAKSTLFDAPQTTTYGDVVNFRCTSQGVACDVGDPDLNQPGTRDGCHSKPDSTLIAGVPRYVDFLSKLKPDARDVFVAGIVGNTTPFTTVSTNGVTTLASSCPSSSGMALPAVRTSEFVNGFDNRVHTSICDGDLSGALHQIAAALKDIVINPCFHSNLADVDPTTPGPQYECSVVEFRRHPGGQDEDLRVIGACGGGALPCWRVEEDEAHCGYANTDPPLALVIDRGGELPAADVRIRANCVTSDEGDGPVL